jgi:hypothetical protein
MKEHSVQVTLNEEVMLHVAGKTVQLMMDEESTDFRRRIGTWNCLWFSSQKSADPTDRTVMKTQ